MMGCRLPQADATTTMQDQVIYDGTSRFAHLYVLRASRYTGKERDAESGNDYFGARYYGSNMGRFMSPDPGWLLQADPASPQSWNQYVYGLNNPLINVDPTGLDCVHINNDTGAYEGFESGDCDNSTEAKANSGYYVDGKVNSISFNGQNQVIGYSASTSDGMFNSFSGSMNTGPAVANLNPYTNSITGAGQSVSVTASSPGPMQSPFSPGVDTMIKGPSMTELPAILQFAINHRCLLGPTTVSETQDAIDEVHGRKRQTPSANTDAGGASNIYQPTGNKSGKGLLQNSKGSYAVVSPGGAVKGNALAGAIQYIAALGTCTN